MHTLECCMEGGAHDQLLAPVPGYGGFTRDARPGRPAVSDVRPLSRHNRIGDAKTFLGQSRLEVNGPGGFGVVVGRLENEWSSPLGGSLAAGEA